MLLHNDGPLKAQTSLEDPAQTYINVYLEGQASPCGMDSGKSSRCWASRDKLRLPLKYTNTSHMSASTQVSEKATLATVSEMLGRGVGRAGAPGHSWIRSLCSSTMRSPNFSGYCLGWCFFDLRNIGLLLCNMHCRVQTSGCNIQC